MTQVKTCWNHLILYWINAKIVKALSKFHILFYNLRRKFKTTTRLWTLNQFTCNHSCYLYWCNVWSHFPHRWICGHRTVTYKANHLTYWSIISLFKTLSNQLEHLLHPTCPYVPKVRMLAFEGNKSCNLRYTVFRR